MLFRADCLKQTTVLIGQAEGLPNITASARNRFVTNYLTSALGDPKGAFLHGANLPKSYYPDADPATTGSYHFDESIVFNASEGETKTDGILKTDSEHKVYGSSNHVTPYNASVKVWQRIS